MIEEIVWREDAKVDTLSAIKWNLFTWFYPIMLGFQIISDLDKGRTQCWELPHCAGSGEGVSGKPYPHKVQCEETAIRTWDLSVTGGEALPLHQARPSPN
jgi:hypothetical protein